MKKSYAASLVLSCLFMASCHTSKPIAAVTTADAPATMGPYSQAVVCGNMIYCSGQIGLLPGNTKAWAGSDITSQTNQVLKNLSAVLKEAKSDMSHVVKVTVYLKDMNDYPTFNMIYKNYFPGVLPARAAMQVARLPKDALIEIDCIATVAGK